MYKKLSILLVFSCVILSACVTPKNTNSVRLSPVENATLVQDAKNTIEQQRAVGATSFYVVKDKKDAPDEFLDMLVQRLRVSGYAIEELTDQSQQSKTQAAKLSYQLTTIDNLLFLIIKLGDQQLTRVYRERGTPPKLVPAGEWLKKE